MGLDSIRQAAWCGAVNMGFMYKYQLAFSKSKQMQEHIIILWEQWAECYGVRREQR